MKKISMLLLGLAGLFMTACTETEEGWADPQKFNPEDAITVPGFTASSISSVIDLAQVDAEEVGIFTLSEGALPEGFSLDNARIVLTPQDAEAAETVVNTTVEGLATKAELQTLIENIFGKAPETRSFNGHVYVNAVKDGQAVLIDAGDVVVSLIPEAPAISEAYYVIGGALDWDASAASKEQKFNHSAQSVYDDPVFTITIPAAFDAETGERVDTWFAIGSEEACDAVTNNSDWSMVLGNTTKDGCTDLEGTLAPRSELSDNGSICMPKDDEAVSYKITINMLEYTYSIKPVSAAPQIWYLVGNCIGDGSWGNSFDKIGVSIFPLAASGEKTISYTGFFKAGGQFKLIQEPGSWDAQMNYNNVTEGTDLVTDEDGDNHNIGIVEEGYYTITVNYAEETIAIEKAENQEPNVYNVIGMAGAFQDWKETEGLLTELQKCSGTDHLWMMTYTFDSDTEGKFLSDYAWTVNWGAADFPTGIGTQDGSNISISAGTYVVVFNDITGGYNFIALPE